MNRILWIRGQETRSRAVDTASQVMRRACLAQRMARVRAVSRLVQRCQSSMESHKSSSCILRLEALVETESMLT